MMSPVTLAMKFQFLLLGTLITVFSSPAFAEDPPYENCSSSYSYKIGSTFQNNLNLLLNHLSSNASTSSYHQAIVGDEPDRVYGNFMCYTYFPTQNCLPCVSQATKAIKDGCLTSKDAVRWEEQCQLRYSNQNFFGIMDYSTNITQSNLLNSSDPDLFRSVVKEMLHNLTEKAAFDPSQQKYSIGKHNLTKTDSVYGFVQCTQDLTGNDCERCLQNATTVIQNCCYYYKGARVLTKSCYLRYELYPLGDQGDPTLPSQSTGKRKKVLAIVVLSNAAGLLAFIMLCCFTWYRVCMRRSNEVKVYGLRIPNCSALSHQNVQGSDLIKPQNFPVISFSIIKAATNNFADSNILGCGGFGPVYKGVLPDGNEVAVKRLSCSSEQGSEEFMNEVLLIMKLQHKNLVRLLGCCIEANEKILVYEYMHMGSLDGFLLDTEKRAQLHWSNRFDIVIGIARGLLYLHQDSRLQIIHRDLKTSNILLDSKLNPKISDFGIARIFGGNLGESNTDRIVGTYGYMAPEYAMEGIYSIKSDVFSFGVLLLEIVTGKRNNGFHLSRRAPSLLAYVWELWSEEKELELVDHSIVKSCSVAEFSRCVHVGLLCVQEDPAERPTMASVLIMLLGSESLALPKPHKPAFFGGRVGYQPDQSFDILLANSDFPSDATS